MVEKPFIVALDAGTTSIRAICFDSKLRVIAQAQKEITLTYPQPGWVEQDPQELWQVAKTVLDEVIEGRRTKIAAIGITNQRETTILWDSRTGKPLYNAIVWQCRRTALRCEQLKKRGLGKTVQAKTGLRLDPYFSATKIEWIVKHTKAQLEHVRFGTVDSWLIWNMTGRAVHATDQSNASRTLLYNIRTRQWDRELCRIFRIPPSLLPTVKRSRDDFGAYQGIPIHGVVGDQQSALFAQGGWNVGTTKVTYGTGCFLMQNIGTKRPRAQSALLTTLTPNLHGDSHYALEGSIFMGGAVMQWLRDGLHILPDISKSAAIAQSIPDTRGVTIVPAFTGLGAPYWNPEARGIITGLTRGATWKHVVRAATESMAFQVNDVITEMKRETGKRVHKIVVDGGAVRDNFLLQFQADITGAHITRNSNHESTAIGAAMLAGLHTGIWRSSEELLALQKTQDTFTQKMTKKSQKSNLSRWKHAVGQALHGSI